MLKLRLPRAIKKNKQALTKDDVRDIADFRYNNKALDLARAKTLTKVQETFDLSKKFESATVIWSGNGYHLYICSLSKYYFRAKNLPSYF